LTEYAETERMSIISANFAVETLRDQYGLRVITWGLGINGSVVAQCRGKCADIRFYVLGAELKFTSVVIPDIERSKLGLVHKKVEFAAFSIQRLNGWEKFPGKINAGHPDAPIHLGEWARAANSKMFDTSDPNWRPWTPWMG
jgi:hypothetical protein